MLKAVSIVGDGVAACCCARLLLNRGIPISMMAAERTGLPSILISQSTQNLLSDIFEDKDLFAGAVSIRKRVVLWGNQAGAVALPHSGLVVSESALLQRLLSKLEMSEQQHRNDCDWQILSSPGAAMGQLHRFGLRIATATAVELRSTSASDTCWIEALEQGWLFLLPSTSTSGSLIAVGDSAQSLLEQSRLISQQVGSLLDPGRSFPAYPRLLHPLAGEGWLACGSAAMSFDPICGEGAGNAAREAILVAAALGLIAKESSPASVLAHYSSRLLAGFLRHLKLCREFYVSGPSGEWWKQELTLLEQGIGWCIQTLSSQRMSASYRLVGFDLYPNLVPEIQGPSGEIKQP